MEMEKMGFLGLRINWYSRRSPQQLSFTIDCSHDLRTNRRLDYVWNSPHWERESGLETTRLIEAVPLSAQRITQFRRSGSRLTRWANRLSKSSINRRWAQPDLLGCWVIRWKKSNNKNLLCIRSKQTTLRASERDDFSCFGVFDFDIFGFYAKVTTYSQNPLHTTQSQGYCNRYCGSCNQGWILFPFAVHNQSIGVFRSSKISKRSRIHNSASCFEKLSAIFLENTQVIITVQTTWAEIFMA